VVVHDDPQPATSRRGMAFADAIFAGHAVLDGVRGDLARWPNPQGGGLVRIEHWVLAQRQGQAVARPVLGERTPFTDVPFFWSQQYDVAINYVGLAERWEINGRFERHDCSVRYRAGGRVLAMASIVRDWESLDAELAMEQEVRP
jgi:hypothetical protein